MLTGKQRSYLKSLAHTMKPVAQLGKEGISQPFLDQLSILLDQHEIVKINVLENSSESAVDAANEICTALNAEFVQAIGNKCTIYRQSRIDPMIEIPGADNSRVKINMQKKAVASKKVEPLTKKGGKKSRPLKGKRSQIKARKAEVEAAEALAAKPQFNFFNKKRSTDDSAEKTSDRSSKFGSRSFSRKFDKSSDFASEAQTKTFGVKSEKVGGDSESAKPSRKFGANIAYGSTKSANRGKPANATRVSGGSKSFGETKATGALKSSRTFKSNKRGQ